MANTAEKLVALLVIGALSFVSMSYTITGDFISNPIEWFEQLQYPTYEASFDVWNPSVAHGVDIRNFDLSKRGLSIVPQNLAVAEYCLWPYKGTVTADVESPTGTERIVYDPNSEICDGATKPYQSIFVAKKTGQYTVTITVKNTDGNIVDRETKTRYIEVEG